MGRRRKGELPRYRLHKQSGQAVVSFPLGNNKYRDILLGPFESDASRKEYARLLNEWVSSEMLAPLTWQGPSPDLTVSEICLRFWKHAETYYRLPDGSPSGEINHFQYALDPLETLYGQTTAKQFGPVALKAVRQQMISTKRQCRRVINQRIEHIKRMFRWAVSEELVPPSIRILLVTA
jgi:hypothetical protein